MTPAHWVLGDSTGPTQSFTTGLRSPFGPGARHHTGSSPFINNFSSARESLPSRYFTFTRRTRASIGSLFLESWMSLFFRISFVIFPYFDCGCRKSLIVPGFKSLSRVSLLQPAGIFSHSQEYLCKLEEEKLFCQLYFICSLSYKEPSFAFCLIWEKILFSPLLFVFVPST